MGLGVLLCFAAFQASHLQRPPVVEVQRGYRGTGMVTIFNPRVLASLVDNNALPDTVPYAGDEGVKAGTAYTNVRVLGDVSVGELTRLMVSMTRSVAPN